MLEGDGFQPELAIPVILGRRTVMGLTFLGFGIEHFTTSSTRYVKRSVTRMKMLQRERLFC